MCRDTHEGENERGGDRNDDCPTRRNGRIDRGALEVNLDDGRLVIRGTRAATEGVRARRTERPQGRFVRSFSLPDAVERGSITADYKDGVLLLHLPKRGEQPQPGRVKIEIG